MKKPSNSIPAFPQPVLNRRSALRLFGLGAAGLAASPLLAGCTGTSSGSSGGAGTTFGSNMSDGSSKEAIAQTIADFQKQESATVTVNTVSHSDFQSNINNYLQGNPDSVFTWFSGLRMRVFAENGLAVPVDDVWSSIGSHYSDSVREACSADDGSAYLVPWNTYPWGVFYRKSVFADNGYSIPTTWDSFVALCTAIQGTGMAPIAFGDKELWPALGTFDQINLRLNGYDFHMALMAHEESWDQPRVQEVFDHWNQILPFHQENGLGRTWQEASAALADGTAAMQVIGLGQIGGQITGADADDLDFFPFPEINPEHGQDSVEAPVEGFMLSTKGKDDAVAQSLLEYLGSGEAQVAYLKTNPLAVAAVNDADKSGYTALQQKADAMISGAKHLSQFLDNDTLPAFATNVMQPALQGFISSGSFDAASVETQAKQLFSAA